jgi:cation:H+ antiporter
MLQFANLPLWANLVAFGAAAGVVWVAGTLISQYAAAISRATGIGHAAIGILLLGGITSLPEAAVTITAAHSGNSALAVNNLLGGISMQVAILAVADVAIGRAALTAVVPNPIVLLQGALNILLLSVVVSGIVVGDVAVFGIGLWLWLVLAVYLYGLRLLTPSEGRLSWRPVPELKRELESKAETSERAAEEKSLASTVLRTAAAGAAIVVAGYVLSKAAEAIAEQTGLGSSFVGAVLVAVSTSLPEVSTVLSAVRLGNYTMAISDILGTNLFDAALLFVVDAVGSGEAVLNRVGRFSAFAAVMGIVVTTLFTLGVIERRDRTILRMGFDSAAVLATYLAGLVILYHLR